MGDLLDQQHTEVSFLIEPFLQRIGLAMLVGSSDTGKSSFLRQLALDIVLDKPTFIDFPIKAKYHSVICINTEDDSSSIVPLLKRQLLGQEIPKEARNRLRFVFSPDSPCHTLDSLLTQQPADLVIVDALGDVFDGNLNQSNEVRRFLNEYSKLASKHNCLILFMHHTGKRTETLSPSKNNLLGSQGLEAKMRVVLELRADVRDSQLRHLWILKGNYLPQALKSKSYVLGFDKNQLFHSISKQERENESQEYQGVDAEESKLWPMAKQLIEEGHSHEKAALMLKQYAEALNLKPLSKSAIGRRYPRNTIK